LKKSLALFSVNLSDNPFVSGVMLWQ